MLTSLASNAILSKTRAMFGKRLTEEDYKNMLAKSSVGQIAAYLKKHPGYSNILSNVNEGTIHRQELENLIKQKHFTNFASLCRYELSVGESFADYILHSSEIELILEGIKRLKREKTPEVYFFLPEFLERQIELDLDALGTIKNYDDLLHATRYSIFYKALSKIPPINENYTDLLLYEQALYNEFYKKVFQIINTKVNGQAKEEMLDLFVSYIDLTNIIHIYRLKKYFKADFEYIRNSIIDFGSIKDKILEELMHCEAPDEIWGILKKTRMYKKLNILDECQQMDELPERYIFKKSVHNIRFSSFPPVVMISYLNFSNTEISNIIKIIEGIRYEVEPEKIKELLIVKD